MPAIDFPTALARLLKDGSLRDLLASDPGTAAARMELCDADRAAVLGLDAEDLEFQAGVLLRKRFGAVRRVIPRTCGQLGAQALPLFSEFGRNFWPAGPVTAAADALAFCFHLESIHPDAVSRMERNRMRFAASGRLVAVNLLRRGASQSRPAFQFLFRTGPGRWREVLLYAKL